MLVNMWAKQKMSSNAIDFHFHTTKTDFKKTYLIFVTTSLLPELNYFFFQNVIVCVSWH